MQNFTMLKGLMGNCLVLMLMLLSYSGETQATCYNVTDGGTIGPNQTSCGTFDPTEILNLVSPSGGSGTLEYMWLKSSTSNVWDTGVTIPGATGSTYDPGTITSTTYYLRCSRRDDCSDWDGESNVVCMEICTSGGGSAPVLYNVPADITVTCGNVPVPPSTCDNVSLGYATKINYSNKVKDPGNVLGAPDGNVAEFWDTGDEIDVEFASVLPAGTEICIVWKGRDYTSTISGDPTIQISENVGGSFIYNTSLTTTSTTSFVTQCFTLNNATDEINLFNAGTTPDWEVDAISYTAIDCEPDAIYALDDGACGSDSVTITFSETTSGSLTIRTWTATDDCGNSSSATQTITETDCTPNPVDDNGTTPEDTPIAICLPDNDTDPDGDLDVSSVVLLGTPPASQGSVSLDAATGCITFTPAPDFCGTVDPFDYEISDLAGNMGSATVYINVTCVDDAPVAVDDYDTTNEDVPVIVDLAANDIDLDGDLDPTSVMLLTTPPASQGTVINNGDGTITFVPAPDFCGDVDPFDYEISDLAGNTASATVYIHVLCIDDAPMAVDDYDTTNEDVPVIVDLSSNDLDVDGDLDPSSLMLLTTPPASQGSVINNGDGTITFVPAPGFCGDVDPFDYEISDMAGNTASATVYIHVLCVNDAPVAVDDYDTTFEDVPVIVDLASNDTDVDGDLDPTSVMLLTTPPASQGTVVNNGDGTITFVPAPGFCGDVDPFDYEISDLSGATASATVYIHVICVNDPPVANDDTDDVCNESSTTTDVLANDTDSDGTLDPSSVMVISGPSNGITTVNPDGSITYTHDGSGTTTDSYWYLVADNEGLTSSAMVTITIYDAVNVSGIVTDASCGGADGAIDATVIGGTGPYTYAWSDGSTTEDISGLTAGTYMLTVTDQNGCMGGILFTVAATGFEIAGISVIDASGCAVRDGGLIIDLDDASAGTAPYFITVNGVFTAGPFYTEPIVITGAPAGVTATSVMVTDADGCTDLELGPITIGGPTKPDFASVTFIPAACGDLGGDIVVDIDDAKPGTPPYNFMLAPGGLAFGPYATEPITIEDVPFGSYNSLTVIDANGCKDHYKTHFDIIDPMCVECPVPTNRGSLVNGGKTVDLYWDAMVEALGYELRVRPAGTTTWINVPPLTSTMRRIGTLTEGTTYEWQIRAICGAETSDWSVTETFTTDAYRVAAPESSIEIYPNPANTQFSISYETPLKGDVEIYMYNQLGQLVLSQVEFATTGINTYPIDSRNYAAGIYEVAIYQGNSVIVEKLVIQD